MARPSNPLKIPSKRVAITVSLAGHPELTPDEETSLRHLRHYLGHYDRYVIAPKSMDVPHDDFQVVRFGDEYFGSANAQTRLMMKPEYYETFSDYEYVLTYQLDALALSDQLLQWCSAGFDFIGAPNYGLSDRLSTVCSGGFALRKVSSFLKVLYSDRYSVDPDQYWRALTAGKSPLTKLRNAPRKYWKRLHRFNGIDREIKWFLDGRGVLLEDEFFVHNAARFYPDFKVPTVETALRFAFDETPRVAFEMTKGQLPFGAHAWYKQDRQFYEPYLLR
ncbi:MAG: DUF5672 family protein [Gemmatimonadaceae bacterium]